MMFSKRAIRSAAVTHARKTFGLVRDLHFGWFVVIPIFSSIGSVVAGLAAQTGYLVVALAVLAACSFLVSIFRVEAKKATATLNYRVQDFVSSLSSFSRKREDTALYIPILPERPSLARVAEETDPRAKSRRNLQRSQTPPPRGGRRYGSC